MTQLTVKDLIHKLQSLPPDMLVVTSGYEGGWDSVGGISVERAIRSNWDNEQQDKITWYYGDWSTDDAKNGQDVCMIG